MSAQQFMELLFGKLPEFFKNEAELRAMWSAPDTRKKLLNGLAEKGFGHEQLAEMQKIIDAEKSDLFDVLAYVAYALPPLTREERAARAKVAISSAIQQQAAGLPGLRAGSLCGRRSRGARSGEAHAVAAAEISQLHRRRPGRFRTTGRDRPSFRWLPEVPISASGCRLTHQCWYWHDYKPRSLDNGAPKKLGHKHGRFVEASTSKTQSSHLLFPRLGRQSKKASRILPVHLSENRLWQSQTIDSPSSLRWSRSGGIIEIFIVRF